MFCQSDFIQVCEDNDHYQKNFKEEKPTQGSYTNRLFYVKLLYLLSVSAFTDPRFLDEDLH
jgi:hypothetical protein